MVAMHHAFAFFAFASSIARGEDGGTCPLRSDTTVVYSLANGVGEASQIWVEDLLWWWKEHDASVKYQGLTGRDAQNCDLASYKNLKVWVNPGGDAFSQLSSLDTQGRNNLLAFINRQEPSAYVGFCAGGYLAAKGYYWESILEDKEYFDSLRVAPPLGAFPYDVEGSIVDINDDQYGDVDGLKYRVVNVSNGHKMLYYGGSTFGWNQAPPVTSDPDLEVLAYYTDFYGYLSHNIPAAWKYKNLLLTSVHPEADNCTIVDCPAEGSLSDDHILQNRAWLVTHINKVAGTDFVVPNVPLPPVFDTTPPHTGYPAKSCNQGGSSIIFCDDFDAQHGVVASGLWSWQRTQSKYNKPGIWNTTYTSAFGSPAEGNGFAVASVDSTSSTWASLSSFPVTTVSGSTLSFQRMGSGQSTLRWTVQYTTNAGQSWVDLQVPAISSTWEHETYPLPSAKSLQVRFNCAGHGYCGLDSVYITAPAVDDVIV